MAGGVPLSTHANAKCSSRQHARRVAGEGEAEATLRPPAPSSLLGGRDSSAPLAAQQEETEHGGPCGSISSRSPPTDDELGPGAVGSVCSPKATNATTDPPPPTRQVQSPHRRKVHLVQVDTQVPEVAAHDEPHGRRVGRVGIALRRHRRGPPPGRPTERSRAVRRAPGRCSRRSPTGRQHHRLSVPA